MILFLAVLSFLISHLQSAPNTKHGNSRIIGGEGVNIEQYPYTVEIESRNTHVCSGAIIEDEWVVTSARCIPQDSTTIDVRSGSSYRGAGGTVHKVTKALIHPQFQGGFTYSYDVALLTVDPKFEFGTTEQPVWLSAENAEHAPSGVVTGWGSDNEDNPNSNTRILQMTQVDILNQTQCDLYNYGNTTLCSTINNTNSPCGTGDIGDPLVAYNVVMGILSVPTCHEVLAGDIYTDVGKVRDWIRSTTGI